MKLARVLSLAVLLAVAGCGSGKADQNTSANAGVALKPASVNGGGGGPVAAAGAGAGGGGGSAAGAPAPRRSTARGAERTVFSLDDNRLLAHALRGAGLVVVPGSAGFAKYLRFGRPKIAWKMKQVVDGRRAAVADLYASFEAPLTAEQARAATAVTMHVHSPVARRLSVKVNGKEAGTRELGTGWQVVSVPVAAGLFQAGENNVQLISSKGDNIAVEWIQLGGDPGTGDAAPPIYDAQAKALVLPQGGGLAYYVQVPQNGRVVGQVMGDGCEVQVSARGHGGAPVAGTIKGDGAVELGALAGQIVRLELIGAGCPTARLAHAALAAPGEAPRVQKPKKPKYVILWIMDSLRADRVRPFNPKARPETPNFEKWATEGAIFLSNYTQGNESRASHASIWSSQYVANHRLIPGGAKKLEEKWPNLPHLMKAAGFFTSGVSANGYVTTKMGFGEWHAYRNHIHDGGGVMGQNIFDHAIKSVEKRHDKPWFLYIGTIDTHVSWRAKEPWMSKYDPEPYGGKYVTAALGPDIDNMAAKKITPSPRDLKRIIAIYDSNVSYQDDLIAKLFQQLEAWGIKDETMMIITADHGDEQWEAGRVGHGASVRESLVHVPLAIWYPPLFPAGLVEEGVDTLDVLPTILDAIGVTPPEELQGESLIPLAQGVGRGYPRPSFTSMYEIWYAMRLGGWKIVAGGNEVRVYHVAKDLDEKNELAAERPIERRFLTDAMSTFVVYQKQWRKARWGVASNMTALAADELER